MAQYDIYGIGAALVDMEFKVSDEFLAEHKIEKGLMTLVEPEVQARVIAELGGHAIKKASGGSAANTIMAASNFGANTFYSCKAAQDATGDFFVEDINKAGADCNLTNNHEREEGTTGTCLVMVTPDAERTMNTYLGISETLSENELNTGALAQSSCFYIEGYLATSDTGRAAAVKGRQMAEANNVKTAITFSDPAMVQFFKDQINEMLGDGVDLLFCNSEEAMLWADTEDLDTALEKLKTVAKTFAVTRGSKGAILFDGSQIIETQAQQIIAVDTNGAGDMFAGAFMFGLSQGYDFEKSAMLANLAAGKVVSQFGPRLNKEDHITLLSLV